LAFQFDERTEAEGIREWVVEEDSLIKYGGSDRTMEIFA
jgi:hypothetical protein